jgi:hypothetical protein
MGLKINSSSLLEKVYLSVESDGVTFYKSAFTGSKRRFRFRDIECILLSPENLLSFQVGHEIFSLPVKPDNSKHQKVISVFVNEVMRANGQAPS